MHVIKTFYGKYDTHQQGYLHPSYAQLHPVTYTHSFHTNSIMLSFYGSQKSTRLIIISPSVILITRLIRITLGDIMITQLTLMTQSELDNGFVCPLSLYIPFWQSPRERLSENRSRKNRTRRFFYCAGRCVFELRIGLCWASCCCSGASSDSTQDKPRRDGQAKHRRCRLDQATSLKEQRDNTAGWQQRCLQLHCWGAW